MTGYHIVGDIHGSHAQLVQLLALLGYEQPDPEADPHLWLAPEGYRLVSVGDIVDRGPEGLRCLRTLRRMVETEQARLVLGNHDWRYRKLLSQAVLPPGPSGSCSPGRWMSGLEILSMTSTEREEWLAFLDDLPTFLELDGGALVVVHARWDARFRRAERLEQVSAYAFGHRDSLDDEDDDECGLAPPPTCVRDGLVELPASTTLPARARWVAAHRGGPLAVWGHQVVSRDAVTRIGRTVNVESGAFLGGALSAYIYPDNRVAQAWGAAHWSKLVRRYAPARDVLFPADRATVAEVVRHERLTSADDYLAWIDLELDRRSVPHAFPALLEAHRALFQRVVDAG